MDAPVLEGRLGDGEVGVCPVAPVDSAVVGPSVVVVAVSNQRDVCVTLPPARSAELCRRLQDLDDTLSVRLHRGASVQPEGDVVEAEVLDRELAVVMTLADEAGLGRDRSVSVTTAPRRAWSVPGR